MSGRVLLPLVATLCASSATAVTPDAGAPVGPREFQRQASPTQVQLGERLTYTIVLHHPKDERYEWRVADLGAFDLIEQKRSREDGASDATTTVQLTLALFELGLQKIPDLAFDVTTPQGIFTWSLPGVEVEGVGVLPADAQAQGAELKDLKPLAEVPVRTYRLLWWLLGLLAALAAAYGAFRWWKRPRAAPVVVAPPPLPLHERTRKALDALAAEDLPGQGQVKDFYFRLSELLRGYLGERYGFDALESTRHELLEGLRKRHTPGLPMEDLTRLVDEAELVKFAKAEMGALECKRALEVAYRTVDSTPFSPPPVAAGTVTP